MERFKFMLDYSEEAVEMCSTPLAPGEMVRVIKGPLAGMEGELVNVDGRSKVVVRLEMLGYAGVDMPVGFVEAVK
jgi:transcriptional antiterminator NusG